MRQTKIVCTIGPASESKETLKKLAEAGMNVARINMSHADRDTLLKRIKMVDELNKDLVFPVSTMVDTQGTDLRLKAIEYPIVVDAGEMFELRVGGRPMTGHKGAEMNMNVFRSMRKGMKVFIDDGTIELQVEKIGKNWALCRVNTAGLIKSRKAINIPSLKMEMSGINSRDLGDITFAIKNGIDMITLSFIRHRREVAKVKRLVRRMRSNALIISKIEDATGMRNIDEIIDASDGIMVARGDLGAEIQLEEVPLAQKMIIDKCLESGKPVIVATQMMESMVENPRPTRAEVSDIANAVNQKADAVMLSAETSVGKYPVRCVDIMSRICERMEMEERFILPPRTKDRRPLKEEITISAAHLARNLDAKAIIVFTKTGELAKLTSKQRPTVPVFAFAERDDVRRSLTLNRSVYANKICLAERSHKNTSYAIEKLKRDRLIDKGDTVVIISDVFKGHENSQIIWVKRVS